jgi:pimeloyl-ACP methyl ester carboxylesterase
MTNFVLVHGAWHGSWCWQRLVPKLVAAGHRVHTPTLTGLGEDSANLTPDVGLATHVEDVVTLLNDLTNVVLVGHSYAGFVVREAADRVPGRVAKLILVDGWAGTNRQSLFDRATADFRDWMRRSAHSGGDGWRIPAVPPAAIGVTHPDDVAWVAPRLTDQPLRSFSDPTVAGHSR